MGFSSWLCAKSNESIPVPEKEQTEVTLYLPDGKKLTGFYDGYGRIYGTDNVDVNDAVKQSLQKIGELNPPAIRKLISMEHTDIKGNPGLGTKDTKAWEFTYEEAGKTRKWSPFEHMLSPDATKEEALKCFNKRAESASLYEFIQSNIKICKTKYVTDQDTFDTLKVSERCPFQGYFYEKPNQWTKPLKKT